MKRRRQNVTISRRVTRSATTLHRNSLPIPDELVFEIYSRLPSKTIASCRCVCKLWASMLRRQDFTELFLTRSSARPQILFVCEDDKEIVFFSSPQLHNPEDTAYIVASNRLARFPGKRGYFCNSGFSCRGFNLVVDREGEMDQMMICNPSTGQSLRLPRLKLPSKSKTSFVFTYNGYDPIGKNFKLLSIVCWSASNGLISVEHQVLTLGAKRLSWRKVECCIPHHPCYEWICINGVLYYLAEFIGSSVDSVVVCFDLTTEKFTVIDFKPGSTNLVNYNGKLGLLMSEDSRLVYPSSRSIELWVAGENEWSKHVYVLPPSWKDVVTEIMCIAGMVGVNEIVLSPRYQYEPYYVIYYNVERKTITKVEIRGMEGLQGKSFNTYLNYVENVELI